MDTHLLDKWLNGTHTAEDLATLERFPEFAAYQKIDAYVQKIEIPSFDTEAGLRDVKIRLSASPPKASKVRTLPVFLKIAAILTILAASYVFINSLPTQITTQLAETKVVTLPDTSEVVLNGNSKLSYSDNRWDTSRSVTLQGEAYFKVAKGETFDVHTSQGQVTVLGTQFNVLETTSDFTVTCYEGSVAVTHKNKTITLTKGEQVTLVQDSFQLATIFTNKPEWIINESSYTNVAIEHVLRDFENSYHTSVTTKNIDVTLRYTGSFTHTDLETALQTITIPLGLTYTIESESNIIITPKNPSE